MRKTLFTLFALSLVLSGLAQKKAKTPSQPMLVSEKKLESLKAELVTEIDKMKDFSAEMNDMIFSFGELGFQEEETSKYLIGILEKNGFTIQKGIAGIPTAWT
ncbi:MAG: amidohydrolase, partial [Sphingobacteriaceae bacterium]|nr:amidohydrolase [Cytophagaceae bacterium]